MMMSATIAAITSIGGLRRGASGGGSFSDRLGIETSRLWMELGTGLIRGRRYREYSNMCEAHARNHAADGAGDRLPIGRLIFVAVAVVASAILVIFHPGRGGPHAETARADVVFVSDLTAATRDGINSATNLGRSDAPEAARMVGRRYAAAEQRQLSLLRTFARDQGYLLTATGSSYAAVGTGRHPLQTLQRHIQQDLVLARIELSAGRDPRLLRLARSIEVRERATLRSLSRLTPTH